MLTPVTLVLSPPIIREEALNVTFELIDDGSSITSTPPDILSDVT